MKLKRDQITGGVLVLLGLVVAVLVNAFRVPMTAAYPGPRALPLIAVAGFIICGAGIFVNSTRSGAEETVFLVREGWVRLAFSLGLLAVYILAMKYTGYLLATPVAAYLLTTVYAKGSHTTLRARVIYALVLTAVIYIIYVYAFGLGLPSGELFG